MHKVVVEKIINRPFNEVYNILINVENWKKLSNSFRNIEIIVEEGNKHLTLQTTKHGREFKQYTLRKFLGNKIEFIHITPAFPLKQHFGEWVFEKVNEGKTKIILIHIFEIPFSLIGILMEKMIGKWFFEKNVERMLNNIKKGIEEWPEKE